MSADNLKSSIFFRVFPCLIRVLYDLIKLDRQVGTDIIAISPPVRGRNVPTIAGSKWGNMTANLSSPLAACLVRSELCDMFYEVYLYHNYLTFSQFMRGNVTRLCVAVSLPL